LIRFNTGRTKTDIIDTAHRTNSIGLTSMSSNFISASIVETLTGNDRTFVALRGFSYSLLNGIITIFYFTYLIMLSCLIISDIPYTSIIVYISAILQTDD